MLMQKRPRITLSLGYRDFLGEFIMSKHVKAQANNDQNTNAAAPAAAPAAKCGKKCGKK